MIIVKAYKENETYRNSFFELAKRVHGIDFSGWYQNGYWKDGYIPYSVWMDNQIVANVSVNRMAFRTEEGEKHYIQLGTVMTAPEYRNRGLIRKLMEQIETDYGETTEGWYLFANDTVLDFYPKFGFHKVTEYQAVKKIENASKTAVVKVPMETKEDREKFANIIESSVLNSAVEMINNAGLYMFYLSQFMKDTVYFIESEHTYAIAEVKGGILHLFSVFGDKKVNLDKVIAAFGEDVKEVRLGFTPLDKSGYELIPFRADDTTTFVKGECFADYEARKIMFPELSHA